MTTLLSDEQSNTVDNLNRFFHRDRGNPGYGDSVKWTQYAGSDFTQIIRNTATGGQHLAILLAATTATASPTAANSVFIVQDGAVAVCAGKPLNLHNAAGSNLVNLYHSGTNGLMKTDAAFTVAGGTLTVTSGGITVTSGGITVTSGNVVLANGSVTLTHDDAQFSMIAAGVASDVVLVFGTTSDTTPGDEHFAITAGGTVSWGPGGATARDVTLARSGTRSLTLTGNLALSSSDGTMVLAVNTTAAAALQAMVAIERSGSTKGYLGIDANDNFVVLNGTPATVAMIPSGTLFFLPTVPTARVNASGTTVGSASATALTMDTSTYDTDSMYDATNKRIKIIRAGKYRISGCAEYGASAAGTLRWTRLRLNNTTDIANTTTTEPAGTLGTSQVQHALSTSYVLAVNDFLTVYAYQDSGGNLTVSGHMVVEFVSI
jgi:hypothetical protein